MPALPEPSFLRLLSIAATFGLAAFGTAFGVALWHRLPRRVLAWTLAPLLLATSTFALAGRWLILHELLSLVIVGVGLRNAFRLRRALRVASILGAVGWFLAVLCAAHLFG